MSAEDRAASKLPAGYRFALELAAESYMRGMTAGAVLCSAVGSTDIGAAMARPGVRVSMSEEIVDVVNRMLEVLVMRHGDWSPEDITGVRRRP